MKAVKVTSTGHAAVADDLPVPKLEDNYVLAEAKAWALNPTDAYHMNNLAKPGSTLGCDWAGVVREVGKNVTRVKVGDEVFGVCHGGNQRDFSDGAFGEMVLCKENAVMRKRASMSWDEAATLGVGVVTIGQAFYLAMGLEVWPGAAVESAKNGESMLIYGASSTTGAVAVQIAKLVGYTVYTMSSAQNFGMLRERGADYTFDYRDPEVVQQIATTARGKGDVITVFFDCIGPDVSGAILKQLLLDPHVTGSEGTRLKYHSVKSLPPSEWEAVVPKDERVSATTALAYTLLGDGLELEGITSIPPNEAEYTFVGRWAVVAEELVADGKIRGHPVELMNERGLDGVVKALNDFDKLSPSGKKVVCLAV